jgi:prepilin-type processing-associated H-X9-DG protein
MTTAYDSDLDHCSYAINWSINGYSYYAGYGCTSKPRKGYAVTNPRNTTQFGSQYGGRSNSPVIMDKHKPQWGWVINYAEWNVDTQWGLDNAGWDYAFRHPGKRANVLYLDGHVDTVRHFFVSGKPNYVEIFNYAYSPPDPLPCGPSDCPPCP